MNSAFVASCSCALMARLKSSGAVRIVPRPSRSERILLVMRAHCFGILSPIILLRKNVKLFRAMSSSYEPTGWRFAVYPAK